MRIEINKGERFLTPSGEKIEYTGYNVRNKIIEWNFNSVNQDYYSFIEVFSLTTLELTKLKYLPNQDKPNEDL